MADSKKLTQRIVSEEQLRAEAIRELGIEDLTPEAQEEIIATVRETILEYINIAVMKALGKEGMIALGAIEENSEAFAEKLVELLPNIGVIVKQAVEEGIKNHRAAVEGVRKRFGAPAKVS